METKTVIVTGGNSGLGLHAAMNLVREGWHVVIASRNAERNADAVTHIRSSTGRDHVTALALDLGSLASVRAFVDTFTALDVPPLHAIVCNAGITLTAMRQSADGHDLTFAVNHLGHFLLVNLLLAQLRAPGRVVMVSSGTHIPSHRLARLTGVPVPKYTTAHNLAYAQQAAPADRITNPAQAYSTSKLLNVLFAYELSRRLRDAGISTLDAPINTYALDPGLMPDTAFTRDFPKALARVFQGVFIGLEPLVSGVRRVRQSGQHLARLVTDPALDGVTAAYFDGDRQVESSPDSYDRDKARDLWDTSVALSGLGAGESLLYPSSSAEVVAHG